MSSNGQQPTLSLPEKAALLRRQPLFRDLDPQICDRLAANAKTKLLPRGTTIFTKGDPGTYLFAVVSGIVQVTTASREGKSAIFNRIGEGDIVGEIAFLDGRSRTADAAAFTDCRLMIIERRDFLPLLRDFPDVAIKLLELLCARLRRTSEQVEDLMFLDLRSRLAKTLMRLSPSASPDGAITISQSELSDIVGMSREMINKQLQLWARDGCIKLERRRLYILRPATLNQIAAAEG